MTAQTISLELNLCAFGAIILILILSVLSLRLKERVHFWFFGLVVSIFLYFLLDLVIALVTGYAGSSSNIWVRILDSISYSIGGFQIVIYAWYLYEYLRIKTTVSKKPFKILSAIGAVTVLMCVIAFLIELSIRPDEYNTYVRRPMFWFWEISFVFVILISMGIIIRYAKFLRAREEVSLILYLIAPIICSALEVMIPGLYIALFGASFTTALIYVNIQMELIHEMRLKEAELTEKRIAIMLSQIQPHFLYNVLATIDDLVFEDQEVAHRAILDFSKYLRGNMDSLSQKELILFSKELAHTKQYLRLEELRFRERLRIVYDIGTESFMLPVLTLQPIVENAVRYGVTKKRDGGTITIRTEETSDCYYIIVSDDGVGFDMEKPFSEERSHNGIANVRNRIMTMCGGSLTIESEIDKGTKSIIEIPKQGGKYE
ncbi:sensor histidine kinase [Anaerosporobacter sp.]|uniref:sensor histidine kinase n=1 Tax=Anaerosporobacter sp. TaxID=1872529 RepID=UPI00286F255F|nr:histidine kinase [Anaerosporobacter sp.]